MIANYNLKFLLKTFDKQEESFKRDSFPFEKIHDYKNLDRYFKSYVAFIILLGLFFYEYNLLLGTI
jgi:hypothetical protein